MSGRNGILLPGQQPPQAQMVIAAPFNDVQLVAMVAAHLAVNRSPADAVADATEIVAEAVVRAHKLPERIKALVGPAGDN